MPNYTYSYLKGSVNSLIHNKIDVIADPRTIIGNAVTETLNEVPLKSLKRKTSLPSGLFSQVFRYYCPADLRKPIGIVRDDGFRYPQDYWNLISPEEFDQRKHAANNLIAVDNSDGVKSLLISTDWAEQTLTLSNCESLTGVTAFGDAENIDLDAFNVIDGNYSLSFGLSSAGGTTAGVQFSNLQADLTDLFNGGVVFTRVRIFSAVNITNFKLRIGSDSSNYYEATATATHEGASFSEGFNTIRFSLTSALATGSPDLSNITYMAVYMTKSSLKISESGYNIDYITASRGVPSQLSYYSRYIWRSAAGTFKPLPTADDDYLAVEEDEYNMILDKATEACAKAAREYDDARLAANSYMQKAKAYRATHKGEALQSQSTYYETTIQ